MLPSLPSQSPVLPAKHSTVQQPPHSRDDAVSHWAGTEGKQSHKKKKGRNRSIITSFILSFAQQTRPAKKRQTNLQQPSFSPFSPQKEALPSTQPSIHQPDAKTKATPPQSPGHSDRYAFTFRPESLCLGKPRLISSHPMVPAEVSCKHAPKQADHSDGVHCNAKRLLGSTHDDDGDRCISTETNERSRGLVFQQQSTPHLTSPHPKKDEQFFQPGLHFEREDLKPRASTSHAHSVSSHAPCGSF
jgi:hypothetical protein